MSDSNTTQNASAVSRDLVVARFAEDLSWLGRVPSAWRQVVYNKGEALADSIVLPNVGREAHTYLHHLVERYDDLAEWTLFTQGFPFDHVPDFHRILSDLTAERSSDPGFIWLGLFVDYDVGDGSRLFQGWSKNEDGHGLDLDGFWTKIMKEPVPDRYSFFPGGIFAAHRDGLRQRSKAAYREALEHSVSFPDAAHCFERIWDRFLGANGIPEDIRSGDLPVYLRPVKRLGITWETRTRIEDHPFYC